MCPYPASEALWVPVPPKPGDVVVHYRPSTPATLGCKHLKEVGPVTYMWKYIGTEVINIASNNVPLHLTQEGQVDPDT